MTFALHPTATAAGKIILLGEHAVVYGEPALAAGLRDGLCLRASPLPDPTSPTVISIPAWDVDLTLTPDNEHPVARAALAVLGHCDAPLRGYHIEGEARIPSRAGLGSSAALTVALARLGLGPGCDIPTVLGAATEGERVFHGAPSGIDAHVAATGGVVKFSRDRGASPLEPPHAMELLIVPTGVPRDTGKQVDAVRARVDAEVEVYQPLIRALGSTTMAGIEALLSGDRSRLAALMNTAHDVLNALGVGHPSLEQARAHALESGALAAKLTGAGGGGCLVVLPPEDGTEPVAAGLRQRGHAPLITTVGAP